MMSGVRIVTIEKLQPTLHCVRKRNPLNPRSLSEQCSVSDGRPHESFSSPLRRGTVQSASDLTFVVQPRYLSLKKEGGVQEWRPLYFSSRNVPVSGRWPVSDIAEAAGVSQEIEGEQIGTSGSIEENPIVDGGLLSEEGQFSRGFKLDLVEGIKDLARKAEILKEDVTSLDFTVSPTPYTPIEGVEAIRFAAICVSLLFVFWLGNYYVPDLIFKDTVFRKEPEEDPLDPIRTTSGDKILTVSNQESPKGSTEASKNSKGDGESPARKSGAGFSQNRKQNRQKSAKRK